MEWTTFHPTKPGTYWVSVNPRGRNPAPWVVLPVAFLIFITTEGKVWEFGKTEPTYDLNSIPESCHHGVKYAPCESPPDPWAQDAA